MQAVSNSHKTTRESDIELTELKLQQLCWNDFLELEDVEDFDNISKSSATVFHPSRSKSFGN